MGLQSGRRGLIVVGGTANFFFFFFFVKSIRGEP